MKTKGEGQDTSGAMAPMPEDNPRAYSQVISAPSTISMEAIGVVRSQHFERHGTPRQASVEGEPKQRSVQNSRIELFEGVVSPHALRDLEGFERIWVIAHFHLNQGHRSLVVPPRGARKKRGLYSTRSPHRKNGIGLSCCCLSSIEGLTLHLGEIDLLDGTPVLDIKPYLPFADAFPHSKAGWVDELEEHPAR